MSAESSAGSAALKISLLTPNERRRLVHDEQRRRRIARLIQVRTQTNQEAARIRQRVQDKKQMELARVRSQLMTLVREEKRKTLVSLRQKLDDSFRDVQQAAANEREAQKESQSVFETKSTRERHLEAVKRHQRALRAVKQAEERQKTQSQQQLLLRRRAVAQANARSRQKLVAQPIISDGLETSVWTVAEGRHRPTERC